MCGRCSTVGKHLASQCFAKDLSCHICKMKGHISKACRNKSQTNRSQVKVKRIEEKEDDEDVSQYFVMNYVGKKSAMLCSSRHFPLCFCG